MFFNNTPEKVYKHEKYKPVIDLRDSFEKGFKDISGLVESNQDLIEEVERNISIEQSAADKENSGKRDIPIRFEDFSDFTGGAVVSSAVSYEKKQAKAKLLEEHFPDLKKALFEGVLFVLKNFTILSAYLWQKMDNLVRSLKYGGVNFDTKYTDEQLFYMAISIPSTIQNASELLSIFPLMSSKHRYRLIQLRKDKLAMFNRIFKKR